MNDAHISLIETLQMLQIRQTDAVVDHLVQFLKLGNKKFSTQIHPKARIHFALKFVFAKNLSCFRSELTFQLDFKSRFVPNKISSVHQVYKITFQFQAS